MKGVWTMERPKISQIVIDEFSKVIDSQDNKGMEKYGVSIDDAEDASYNWPMMAMEELADFSKYQVKEILKLQKNNAVLIEENMNLRIEAEEISNESAVMIEQLQKELRVLKSKTWYKVYQENLHLAQEVERLKDDKDLYQKLIVKGQLKE
jgi:hypothetical protein